MAAARLGVGTNAKCRTSVASGEQERKLLTWAAFSALLARHPLPLARITHRYTRWNEALS
jgi:hypothetical protein